jgi:O-antigen ligase
MKHILVYCIPLIVALGLVAIREVDYFLLLLVLPTMVWPQTLASPGGTQIALADLLTVVAVAGWVISNSVRAAPDPYVRGNRVVLPALVFIAVNLLSVTWSEDPRSTLVFVIQLVNIVLFIPLIFGSVPRSLNVIRRGLLMYILVTCGLAIATCIVFLVNIAHGNAEGTYLPGIHKNALGSFLAAGAVLAYAFLVGPVRIAPRRLMAVAALVELLGTLASVSRGAVIGGFVSILVVSLLLRRRRLLTVAALVVGAAVYLSVVGPTPAKKVDIEGSYDSSLVRKYAWAHAVQRIKDKPFLGSGAGTYNDYISQLEIGVADPTNMFLLTWAEAGVLGIAALLWVLVTSARLLWQSRRLPPEAATLAVACGGVTLAFFVHFQVDITWTRGTSTLAFAMVGLMVALQRLSQPHSEAMAVRGSERVDDPRLITAG